MNKLVLVTHECSREKKTLCSNDLLLRIVYTVANAQSPIGRNLRLLALNHALAAPVVGGL